MRLQSSHGRQVVDGLLGVLEELATSLTDTVASAELEVCVLKPDHDREEVLEAVVMVVDFDVEDQDYEYCLGRWDARAHHTWVE